MSWKRGFFEIQWYYVLVYCFQQFNHDWLILLYSCFPVQNVSLVMKLASKFDMRPVMARWAAIFQIISYFNII